jgi:hypothetical protein
MFCYVDIIKVRSVEFVTKTLPDRYAAEADDLLCS